MLLAIPFFVVVGFLLPLFGWLGLRNTQSNREQQSVAPTVQTIVAQLAVLQTIVLGVAALAVYGTGVGVTWLSEISLRTVLVAIAALCGMSLLSYWEARRPLGRDDRVRAELRKVSAGNPAWIGVTIYAGFIEEFAYRGVLTLLLAGLSGYWPAAVMSSVLFGLAHLASGRRAASHGVLFALAMQGLVYLSGGLMLAVAVHAVYDLFAAWLGHRMAEQCTDKTTA